jgi:outer membrane protein TolC
VTRISCFAGLASLVLFAAHPAIAQVVEVPTSEVIQSRAFEPARLAQQSVGLLEAVTSTIRQSPSIRRAAERLVSASGRHQQSRGIFDATLRSAPSVNFSLQQMTPFLRSREIGKRETIQNVADEYTALTAILRQIIRATPTDPVRCPSNLSLNPQDILLDRVDPTEKTLLGIDRNLFAPSIEFEGLLTTGALTGDGVTTVLDLGDICQTPVDPFFSPEAFNGAMRQIDQSAGLGLSGVLTSVAQIPREIRILQEQITQTVALRAKLTLDKLGPVPADDLKINFAGDISFAKLLRNGLAFDVGFEVQSQEHNFVDKPLDPSYGGLGLPDQFFSELSASLNIPLARGRGRVSTAAPERASERIVVAEREQLRHIVSEEVFRTILAYVNLVTARETLRLLEQSTARNTQIQQLTQQRVTGGDLPGMEVGRVQARAARVAASAVEARVAVQEARVSLAESMGVSLITLDEAPLSVDSLTTVLTGTLDTQALLDSAHRGRYDVQAAEERREASAILAAGARADERPMLDLTLTGGISNFYDSPFFRYLADGPDAIQATRTVPITSLVGAPGPVESPVRYYDPRGFYRSVTGRYEPFMGVKLTWQLPFGNNSAKGRSSQAAATLRDSSIQLTDLQRVIDERVLSSIEAVRRSEEAVRQSQLAVQAGQQVYTSALQSVQNGDLTIVDALLTEEGVTTDELALARQRQAYLSALARLKFETASLVTFEDPNTAVERIRFQPTDFVGR